MDELVRWLGEQLDEDERIARAASDGPWRSGVRSGLDVVEGDGWTVCNASDVDVAHIARHDPARVLREIDAKRQIVDRYEELRAASEEQGLIGDVTEEYQDFLLRTVALPYADRPGYREEWRP